MLSLGGSDLSGPGCGVLEHGSDCLCDVHIGQRSVMKITELADLPFVQGTVERLGVGVPWTAADLASVMRVVLHAHDLKQRRLAAERAASRRPAVVDGARGEMLKLHAAGLSITEVMGALQLSFEDWRSLLLPGRNNPMHGFGCDDFLSIERRVRSGEASCRALALELSVPVQTMKDVLHWLGLTQFLHDRIREQGGPHRLSGEERQQMKQWIREGDSPTEVVTKMFNAYGVTVDRSLISHTRNRMTKKGDL